jgi:hypothetical protein
MKRRFTAASCAWLAAALMFASVAASQAPASGSTFAGTWVLDASKSQFGGGPGGGGPGGGGGGGQTAPEETMTVKQEGDKITVERKIKGQQGERTVNDAYTTDGKEGDFTMQMRGNEVKGKRTAKLNGGALEVLDKANVETPNGPMTFETTSKWSLSADGKVLTVEQTRTTPRGPQTSKRVYNKQ